jgi:hypothetical protein
MLAWGTDALKGKAAAVTGIDSSNLLSAATAGRNNPPPGVVAAPYQTAMSELVNAANDAASVAGTTDALGTLGVSDAANLLISAKEQLKPVAEDILHCQR